MCVASMRHQRRATPTLSRSPSTRAPPRRGGERGQGGPAGVGGGKGDPGATRKAPFEHFVEGVSGDPFDIFGGEGVEEAIPPLPPRPETIAPGPRAFRRARHGALET